MAYIPTPEKLAGLGFKPSYDRGPLFIYKDQQEREIMFWNTQPDRTTLVIQSSEVEFTLPSEQFFDQLLIAIGWVEPVSPSMV